VISTARVRVVNSYRSNSSRSLNIARKRHADPKLSRETLHRATLAYDGPSSRPQTRVRRVVVVWPSGWRRQKIPVRRARAKKRRLTRQVRENDRDTPRN